MSSVREPAARPCGTCPYRKDVPSGIWSPEEYAKLPPYDQPTGEQPIAVFLCHRQDGRACAGWVGCHDMANNLGLRLAVVQGRCSPEVADAMVDYETEAPLFESGREAFIHGMEGVASPSKSAQRKIEQLTNEAARKAKR